jgi:hypothetical protein
MTAAVWNHDSILLLLLLLLLLPFLLPLLLALLLLLPSPAHLKHP